MALVEAPRTTRAKPNQMGSAYCCRMFRRIRSALEDRRPSGPTSPGRSRAIPPPPPPPSEDPSAWPAQPSGAAVMLHCGSGKEVKGESNYQPALLRAADPLGPNGPANDRRLVVVQLSREPDTQYDPKAVRVSLGGETVGYVPRERTVEYQPFLDWASGQGWDVLSRAHLVGGFAMPTGRRANLGIYLNHSSPPTVQYDGPQPTLCNPDPRRRRDWANINVTGEEQHQELLSRLLYWIHRCRHRGPRRRRTHTEDERAVSSRDSEPGRG